MEYLDHLQWIIHGTYESVHWFNESQEVFQMKHKSIDFNWSIGMKYLKICNFYSLGIVKMNDMYQKMWIINFTDLFSRNWSLMNDAIWDETKKMLALVGDFNRN